MGDKSIPKAHLKASLAILASSGLNERLNLKKYAVKSDRRQTASISDLHMHIFYHIPPTQVFFKYTKQQWAQIQLKSNKKGNKIKKYNRYSARINCVPH